MSNNYALRTGEGGGGGVITLRFVVWDYLRDVLKHVSP